MASEKQSEYKLIRDGEILYTRRMTADEAECRNIVFAMRKSRAQWVPSSSNSSEV